MITGKISVADSSIRNFSFHSSMHVFIVGVGVKVAWSRGNEPGGGDGIGQKPAVGVGIGTRTAPLRLRNSGTEGRVGRVVWGCGLSYCDLQVAGSNPVAIRSCRPPYHRGFGECCLTWHAGLVYMTDYEINGGYGRRMIRQSTRPKIPVIIINSGTGSELESE